jgi:hypothetical protein
MSLLTTSFAAIRRKFGRGEAAALLPLEPIASTERGSRATPEAELKYLYRLMYIDTDVRATILDLRKMDREDPRVKSIHRRVSRDTVRGGLVMQLAAGNETLSRAWIEFERRLELNNIEKLKSDARGLVMEGSLPLQWVLDERERLVKAVRMPAETILPNVGANGQFLNVQEAYYQIDVNSGARRTAFPLWQLTLARFDADNYDDMGALGRPFLDASRAPWKKLRMTEEDLVVRRRTRAPLRLAHTLEGASVAELNDYRSRVEADQKSVTTDFYLNKKGSVAAIQGDSSLDEIKDVVYLMDSFFSGSPVPKGLMGYTEGLNRDILEDIKRDYYEEIDALQDVLAYAYEQGFRFQLLLMGVNPDDEQFTLRFAERRTETGNQTADRALKMQALGYPPSMIFEAMGDDPAVVKERRERDAKEYAPYPSDPMDDPINEPIDRAGPQVSITPNNAPKGESATSITNN